MSFKSTLTKWLEKNEKSKILQKSFTNSMELSL